MKKLLVILLLSMSVSFANENDFKFVRSGVTFSALGAKYLTGDVGTSYEIALEGYFNLIGNNRNYLYTTMHYTHFSDHILTHGESINFGVGFGRWVYRKLNAKNRGWAIGLNMAFLYGRYDDPVATKEDQEENPELGVRWYEQGSVTANMRIIYQLNQHMGFILGADITYHYGFHTLKSGYDGGVTVGIAY